jgi:hypothetical protein
MKNSNSTANILFSRHVHLKYFFLLLLIRLSKCERAILGH